MILYDKLYDGGLVTMVMTFRVPQDVAKAMPDRNRSSWVVTALRKQIRADRARQYGKVAAEHAEAMLKELQDWEAADAFNESIKLRRRRK